MDRREGLRQEMRQDVCVYMCDGMFCVCMFTRVGKEEKKERRGSRQSIDLLGTWSKKKKKNVSLSIK